MNKKLLLPLAFLLWLSGAAPAHAGPLVFTHEIDARDNLFFSDWGHGYDRGYTELFEQPEWWGEDPATYALGGGLAAAAVAGVGGEAVNFADHGPGVLEASVSGWVQDNGAWWTGPDGDAWLFRGLRAYSAIGVWSSDPEAIQPLAGLEAFFIGSFATLDVPLASAGAYLFLANNDGWFHDNADSYQVSLVMHRVPEPGTLGLLSLMLLGLVWLRRS